MEEQQQHIDDIFRQSLGDYREVPPAATWDKVAARLDGEDNRRRGTFQRWPWIMTVLLLLLGGAWFVMTLYGRGSETDHGAEHAAGLTNTRPEVHAATEPGQLPAPDGAGLPGNEAKPAIAGPRSEPAEKAPAQVEAGTGTATTAGIAAAVRQSSGKPANTARRKTAVTAPVSDNTLTATPSTASSSLEVAPPLASSSTANAPRAATRTIYDKKTTVYGKMVVVEELPVKDFSADVPAITKTPIGTSVATITAAQESSTPTDEELLAKSPIASATPKAKQPVTASQKAPVTRKDASPGQVTPATTPSASPANKDAVAVAGKPAVVSGKRKPADSKSPVRVKAATTPATGTIPAATTMATEKPVAQKVITPTAKARPIKEPVASATPKAKQSTHKSQKGPITQKDASSKQSGPATATVAMPLNRAATGTIPPATAKTQSQKARQARTTAATSATTTTTAKRTSPALQLSEKPLATKEAIPKLSAAPPLIAAQPKTQNPAVAATTPSTTLASADTAGGTKSADSAAPVARPKYRISPSFAALGGYEFGMQNPAPGRVTAAARLLFHVSPRASIGLQPAIRYGTVASQKLTDEKMYQRSDINVNSFTSLAVSPSIRNAVDTLYHYVVRETFDSIVVGSATAGGKSLEFELPVIFNYKLGKAWHVYGGPSLNFGGKLVSTAPSIQTYSVTRKDSLVQSVRIPSSEFVNYFGKSSLEPYSNYQPSATVLQDPASIRFGYILGFGYDWKRFIFDASMHQQMSGYENVAQPFQKVYSSPYLRLSFGYTLFPEKKSKKNDME